MQCVACVISIFVCKCSASQSVSLDRIFAFCFAIFDYFFMRWCIVHTGRCECVSTACGCMISILFQFWTHFYCNFIIFVILIQQRVLFSTSFLTILIVIVAVSYFPLTPLILPFVFGLLPLGNINVTTM